MELSKETVLTEVDIFSSVVSATLFAYSLVYDYTSFHFFDVLGRGEFFGFDATMVYHSVVTAVFPH